MLVIALRDAEDKLGELRTPNLAYVEAVYASLVHTFTTRYDVNLDSGNIEGAARVPRGTS